MSRFSLQDLDDILNIAGLDGLVIGPVDLAMSLGCNGDSTQPAVQQAISTILAKAQAAGMPFGTGRPVDDQFEWAVGLEAYACNYIMLIFT